jgi:hypothetical protein
LALAAGLSFLVKRLKEGKVPVAKSAWAEAHTHFVEIIGPTEVAPLLQSLFD